MLANFVWDTEPSYKDDVEGFAGTAIDENGRTVAVFVPIETLDTLEETLRAS